MERFSSKRRYHVIRQRDGRRLAEAETNWVFVNLDSGELAEIPELVATAFGIQR
jgi:acyl-CoA thioesterase FadM